MGRPVGLSQDGRSLIIATSGGEELAVPVDDQLHAALRGDRPRLGQLEIQMADALGPRDIQARIRAGQTLEDVARVAGLPYDRVERFAAPVLAERQHVATLAMSSSVRRRGETSGHRLLRLAVTEKLVQRGIDIDAVDWDAYRLDDGRWSVSASYRSGEASRTAVFVYDLRARFSVAQNDEARWAVGEQSNARGPMPGRRRPTATEDEGNPDAEPTLDLSDELALVRVVQPAETVEPVADLDEEQPPEIPDQSDEGEPTRGRHATETVEPDEESEEAHGGRLAEVRDLYPVPDRVEQESSAEELAARYPTAVPDDRGEEDDTDDQTEHDGHRSLTGTADATRSQGAAPSSGGPSDASAVPDTAGWGWDPAMVVDYPIETGPEPAAEVPAEPEPEEPAADQPERRAEPADSVGHPSAADAPTAAPTKEPATAGDEPTAAAGEQAGTVGDAKTPTDSAGSDGLPAPRPEETDPEVSPGEVPAAEVPSARPAGKRKRASVPSWDEIMFGGPKRSG